MIPYRNGGHLEYCKNFEYNVIFKCFDSYCIPWSYVCDGKWDCPKGDDELNNPVCDREKVCINMYKCSQTSQKCIHIGNVCDMNYDCSLGDDEDLCKMKNIKCPLNCYCLILAIDCRSVSELIFKADNQYPFLSVHMSNTTLGSLQSLNHILKKAIIVKLQRNDLREICYIFPLRSYLLLDLGYNCLKRF